MNLDEMQRNYERFAKPMEIASLTSLHKESRPWSPGQPPPPKRSLKELGADIGVKLADLRRDLRRGVPPWPGPGPEPWWWEVALGFFATNPHVHQEIDDPNVRAALEEANQHPVFIRLWYDAMREEIRKDQEDAFYPGLARKLARAGYTKERWFLRFGRVPKGGASSTAFNFTKEKGVSCFRGRRTVEGHFVLARLGFALRMDLVGLAGADKTAYLLRGKVVGKGIDMDPLLRKITRVERFPDDCVVAVEPASYALDCWNVRRMGALEEVPELARYLKEG